MVGNTASPSEANLMPISAACCLPAPSRFLCVLHCSRVKPAGSPPPGARACRMKRTSPVGFWAYAAPVTGGSGPFRSSSTRATATPPPTSSKEPRDRRAILIRRRLLLRVASAALSAGGLLARDSALSLACMIKRTQSSRHMVRESRNRTSPDTTDSRCERRR